MSSWKSESPEQQLTEDMHEKAVQVKKTSPSQGWAGSTQLLEQSECISVLQESTLGVELFA